MKDQKKVLCHDLIEKEFRRVLDSVKPGHVFYTPPKPTLMQRVLAFFRTKEKPIPSQDKSTVETIRIRMPNKFIKGRD